MVTSLEEVFRLVHDALEEAGAPYMFVGAVAVSIWGESRASEDVDVVVTSREEGVGRILKALRNRGVPMPEAVTFHSLVKVPGTPFKVDLFVQRSERMLEKIPEEGHSAFKRGIQYHGAAFERRTEVPYFGRRIWVSRPEDIIISKTDFSRSSSERFAGDSRDICAILMLQGRAIDRRYLVRWLRYLGLWEQFERIEEGCIPLEKRPARPRTRPKARGRRR